MIQPWENTSRDITVRKTAHAGKEVIYGEMEQEVYDWIVEKRQNGLGMYTFISFDLILMITAAYKLL